MVWVETDARDVELFVPIFFEQIHIEGLVHGNITEEVILVCWYRRGFKAFLKACQIVDGENQRRILE